MRWYLVAPAMLFGLGCLATDGFAQPVVHGLEGVVDRGQQVVIHGAMFGVKESAAPLRWDDFQNGEHGVWIRDLNRGETDGPGTWFDLHSRGSLPHWYDWRPQYSTEFQRFPGDVCAKQSYHHANDPALDDEFWASVGGRYTVANKAISVYDEPSPVWYVSMWIYQDDHARNALYADNAKLYGNFMWRIDEYPQWRWDEYWQGRGMSGLYDESSWELAGGGPSWVDCNIQSVSVPSSGRAYRDNRGKWTRIERMLYLGTPGQADGYYAGINDLEIVRGGGGISNPGECDDNLPTRMQIGHFLRVHMQSTDTYASLNQHISELYVDHSFARVELGNAPTWSACTHREIQVPVAWSDGSITVTTNTGSFADGAPVYLFVVNEDRQPSTGFPLVVGGEYEVGDPGPPGPPGTVSMSGILE